MNDSPGAILARFCCAVAFVTPIGVGILQGAVLISNKLLARYTDDDSDRRRRDAVPMPGLLKAAGVVLAVCVMNAVAGTVIELFLDVLLGPDMDPMTLRYITAVLSLPVGFVIFPLILMPVLPTSFVRACLVTVVQYVLGAVVFGVLIGGLLGMAAAFGALGRLGA